MAHFHNTVAEQMIPCQQNMMLQSALAFENIIKKPKAGAKEKDNKVQITWDNPEELEKYIGKLQASAERLTTENRRLRKWHFTVSDKVCESVSNLYQTYITSVYICIKGVSKIYQNHIKFISKAYQICIKHVPKVYQFYIIGVSNLYHKRIKFISKAYQALAIAYFFVVFSFYYVFLWQIIDIQSITFLSDRTSDGSWSSEASVPVERRTPGDPRNHGHTGEPGEC